MDTVFYVVSKAAWTLLRPETLLVIPCVLALLFLRLGNVGAATKSLTWAVVLLLAVGYLPIGHLVINPLERGFVANPEIDPPAGIIVLGGGEDVAPAYAGGFPLINGAGDRLLTALHLAQRFPDAQVLYAGGKVARTPDGQSTFDVGPTLLKQLGLAEDRLIVEDQSRSTAENAALSLAKLPEGVEGPWVLVTSASHMARAYGSFCAAGWQNVVPYPTDYRGGPFWNSKGWNLAGHLDTLNVGVKEWIGLLAYWATGRTPTFLPKRCS